MQFFTRHAAVSALLIGTVIGAAAQAAPITYNVNISITGPINNVAGNPINTDSVVGTITTDGTIGVLHTANVTSWDLHLNDVTNPQFSYELTNANSGIPVDYGSVLSANATGLSFNFSGSGAFGFQANSPGFFSGYHYFCLNADYFGCYIGMSIAPDHVYAGQVGDDVVVATGANAPIGNQPLDQPGTPPPSVPEPATLFLLGLGLLAAGMARARRIALIVR